MRSNVVRALTAALMLTAAPLQAQVVAPPARAAGAGVWTLDPNHSSVQFSVRHMLVSTVRGTFDGPTGTITYDPANVSATQVDASIDPNTIDTHNAVRDRDLRSDDFFDVAKYPRITFKSKRAEPIAAGSFKVIGDLTMHGVSKEVTLTVEGPSPEIIDPKGDRRMGATATTTIDRRDFGLLYNEVIEGGGAVVSNQVTITLDIEMTRKR